MAMGLAQSLASPGAPSTPRIGFLAQGFPRVLSDGVLGAECPSRRGGGRRERSWGPALPRLTTAGSCLPSLDIQSRNQLLGALRPELPPQPALPCSSPSSGSGARATPSTLAEQLEAV